MTTRDAIKIRILLREGAGFTLDDPDGPDVARGSFVKELRRSQYQRSPDNEGSRRKRSQRQRTDAAGFVRIEEGIRGPRMPLPPSADGSTWEQHCAGVNKD